MSSANEARGRFEVPLHFVSRRVQRFLDLSGVVVGAECPDQGHGLRRRQGEVEADGIEAVCGHLEAVGVHAGEGSGELFAVRYAAESVGCGETSDPSAGGAAAKAERYSSRPSMTSRS